MTSGVGNGEALARRTRKNEVDIPLCGEVTTTAGDDVEEEIVD